MSFARYVRTYSYVKYVCLTTKQDRKNRFSTRIPYTQTTVTVSTQQSRVQFFTLYRRAFRTNCLIPPGGRMRAIDSYNPWVRFACARPMAFHIPHTRRKRLWSREHLLLCVPATFSDSNILTQTHSQTILYFAKQFSREIWQSTPPDSLNIEEKIANITPPLHFKHSTIYIS